MKLSIITPVYNSGKYIKETIDSIVSQTNQSFEHIVIDGLSTDNTTQIVKQYNHIKLVSEKDNGQSNAINKGFKLAEGDILAWQNADDIYFPNTFEIVLNYFENNPEIDIVYGYYQLVNSRTEWICDVYPIDWNSWMFAHGRFCPPQPTVFWRRKVWDTLGGLNEDLHYCMDVDFYSRAINYGFRFQRLTEMIGKFRIHEQSKTQDSNNNKKVYDEYKKVLANNFNYTLMDKIIFELFQQRARITKNLKQNFFKRL